MLPLHLRRPFEPLPPRVCARIAPLPHPPSPRSPKAPKSKSAEKHAPRSTQLCPRRRSQRPSEAAASRPSHRLLSTRGVLLHADDSAIAGIYYHDDFWRFTYPATDESACVREHGAVNTTPPNSSPPKSCLQPSRRSSAPAHLPSTFAQHTCPERWSKLLTRMLSPCPARRAVDSAPWDAARLLRRHLDLRATHWYRRPRPDAAADARWRRL